MYTLTFNEYTIKDLLAHSREGRQFFGAVVVPYSGLFTNITDTFYTELPKILCPYQVNDIIIIQERWARSSNGYVYESDSQQGVDNSYVDRYDYRPAYTMPDDAARLYGRIVSATPWPVTPDIANKYIPSGYSIDKCFGTAKIIGSTDVSHRILRNLRKQRNQEVLGKTYQPIVRTTDPKTWRYVPYQLRNPIRPNMHYTIGGVEFTYYASNYSDSAQAYYTPYLTPSTNPQALESGEPISDIKEGGRYINGAWATYPTSLTISESNNIQRTGIRLRVRGYAARSSVSEESKFIFLMLDDNFNPIPIYAYYVTETISASQPVFAWLISGYLCNKDGNVIGNYL